MTSTIDAAPDAVIAHTEHSTKPTGVQQLARTLIFFLLVAVPLITLPDILIPNASDTPRRLLLLLGSGLLATCLVHGWALTGRVTLRRHALDLPILLFALAAVITGLTGEYPWITFTGPVWSQDGLQVLGTGILLYFAIKEYLCTPEDIAHALRLMVITGGAVALIGICDYLGIISFHLRFSGDRLHGTMGNPMFTGTYLAMLAPLGIGVFQQHALPRWRLLLAACLVLIVTALFFTLTRGAWLACLAALLVQIRLIWRQRAISTFRLPSITTIITLLGISVVLTGGIYAAHKMWNTGSTTEKRLQSFERLGTDVSYTERLSHMTAAARMFLARPLQGWGTGACMYVLPQFRPTTGHSRAYMRSQPHNIILQVAAEMGLLGLLPFIVIIAMALRTGWRTAQQPEVAWLGIGVTGALLAYFIADLLAVDNAATMMQCWVTLALLASFTAQRRTRLISHGFAITLRGCSVLLPLLVVANVAAQLCAGYYVNRGIDRLQQLPMVAKTDPARAERISDQAINDILRSIILTPILVSPHDRLIRNGDAMSFSALAYVYRERSHFFPNPMSCKAEHYLMVEVAMRDLRFLDRDPIMGDLFVEHLRFGELKAARRLMPALLKYSPGNAEVYLLNAQLYQLEGDTDHALTAATTAIQLDHSFGQAVLFLANLHTYQLLQNQHPTEDQARKACAIYQHAILLNETFANSDMAYYTLMLLVANDMPHAEYMGHRLIGTPEMATVRGYLNFLSANPSLAQRCQQLKTAIGIR